MVNRAGFSLAEVVVAFAVLGIAVLSLAAAATTSARWLREAEAESGAALLAAEIVDSLAVAATVGTGSTMRGPYRADWRVRDTASMRLVRVQVVYGDGTVQRTLDFAARTAPPLPELHRVP